MSKVDITGIIKPHNWDEDGRVVQIAIYTNSEEVYLVESNRRGRELLTQINRRVAATGDKKERLDGKKHIGVKKYLILEEIVDEENGAVC